MTTTDVDSISRTGAPPTVSRPNSAILWLQAVAAIARRIDRVALTLVVLMVVLAIFDAQLARRTLGYVASELDDRFRESGCG
jgi:hypothetical protein